MVYISPKIDFAFKKIFGGEESKPILISFLNAIIYQEQPVIKDLTIINPYNPSKVSELKDTYLDVKAILEDDTKVIVKMQALNLKPLDSPMLQYNLAITYLNQLKPREGYSNISLVIAVTVADFNIFPNSNEVITYWEFRERQTLIKYPDNKLQMMFVELPKFTKTLSELETITDKWIYFIKEAQNLETSPQKMTEIPEIELALNLANEGNLTREELEELEAKLTYIRDRQGEVEFMINKAALEGEVKGEIKLILRQLERRFGNSEEIRPLLQELSLEQLEDLGVAILDFTTLEEVVNFIQSL